jgi:hypothetical protein
MVLIFFFPQVFEILPGVLSPCRCEVFYNLARIVESLSLWSVFTKPLVLIFFQHSGGHVWLHGFTESTSSLIFKTPFASIHMCNETLSKYSRIYLLDKLQVRDWHTFPISIAVVVRDSRFSQSSIGKCCIFWSSHKSPGFFRFGLLPDWHDLNLHY